MSQNYKHFCISADCVLIKNNQVLLIKRTIKPFEGNWVLPGGHLEKEETIEEALQREVREETHLNLNDYQLINVYSEIDRDPRERTVSIAFLSQNFEGKLKGSSEGRELKWFSQNNLPNNIGFDHQEIIKDAFNLIN
ncbi:MAG TPA: NUDIX hydrolase [Candidatus Paceibacterota bacterium]|nr:NUDIX hydrolase [Candidatus Paceibacterota bacterium]